MIAYIAHGNLGESEKLEPALAQMEQEWDRLTPAERLLIEWLRSNSRGRRAQARRILEDLEQLAPASLFVNHNLVQNAVGVNRPGAAVDVYDRGRFDERTFATASAPYGISSSSTRCTPGRARSRAAAGRTGASVCAGRPAFSRARGPGARCTRARGRRFRRDRSNPLDHATSRA